MKRRPRAERRARERATEKLGRERERLFRSEPGATPERALSVESAHAVEPRARSVPCPRCGGELAVLEHLAVTTESGRLREARVACKGCGARRSLWLRIGRALPN